MSGTFPPRGASLGAARYRALFELGQGGTSKVSLAADRPEGGARLVVVKQLRALYAQDPDFRTMFMTEGRLSARLNHPHVVHVYEVLGDDHPAIVMEYLEGQTLDSVLAPGEPRLPLGLHLRVLADVLSGLHYSHELRDDDQRPLQVVHRDVSPHNVMISYEGQVKVLDFGIAQLAGTAVQTATGVVKGKLRYMPPEQVAGEKVDRRADVFAVGVMLWEALSGARLWKNLPDAAIMSRVLAGAIPEPKNEEQPPCPVLLTICRRALAPERGERYQTALELQRALEDYLAALPGDASARALSRFMRERFAVTRDEVARRVERELSRSDFDDDAPGRALEASARPSPGEPSASLRSPAEAPRSRLRLLAFGLVLLGVAILFWGVRSKVVPTTPSLVTARAPVIVTAAAASAAVSVDGVDLPNLATPEPAPPPVPSASVVTPPRQHAASVSAAASTPPIEPEPPDDPCDPPFYYAGGIKKFKPECL